MKKMSKLRIYTKYKKAPQRKYQSNLLQFIKKEARYVISLKFKYLRKNERHNQITFYKETSWQSQAHQSYEKLMDKMRGRYRSTLSG